jgi:hypothetical protein
MQRSLSSGAHGFHLVSMNRMIVALGMCHVRRDIRSMPGGPVWPKHDDTTKAQQDRVSNRWRAATRIVRPRSRSGKGMGATEVSNPNGLRASVFSTSFRPTLFTFSACRRRSPDQVQLPLYRVIEISNVIRLNRLRTRSCSRTSPDVFPGLNRLAISCDPRFQLAFQPLHATW